MRLDPQTASIVEAQGAYRFTDADVRRDPELLAQAVRHLQGYYGDWKPLVDARMMAAATGTLSVPVARMVLNAMRCDASARFNNVVPIHDAPSYDGETGVRPGPYPEQQGWEHRSSTHSADFRAAVDGERRPMLPPASPWWQRWARADGSIFLRAAPSMRFLISGWPPADRRVWHVVQPQACWSEWRDGKLRHFHVATWCNFKPASHPMQVDPADFEGVASSFARLPDERPLCRTCVRLQEEADQ